MDRKKRILAWKAMWLLAGLTLVFCILACCYAENKPRAQQFDSISGLCGTFASILLMVAMTEDKSKNKKSNTDEDA